MFIYLLLAGPNCQIHCIVRKEGHIVNLAEVILTNSVEIIFDQVHFRDEFWNELDH